MMCKHQGMCFYIIVSFISFESCKKINTYKREKTGEKKKKNLERKIHMRKTQKMNEINKLKIRMNLVETKPKSGVESQARNESNGDDRIELTFMYLRTFNDSFGCLGWE